MWELSNQWAAILVLPVVTLQVTASGAHGRFVSAMALLDCFCT
jgi:hypothetical protein